MATTARLAVFAGTFDPFTNGHLDIIRRSVALFDRLVVALLVNPTKQPLFSVDDRLAMIRETVSPWASVEVEAFNGLLVDYLATRRAVAVVRGLRSASEFGEEAQMAWMNRHLSPACETVLLTSSPEHLHISSRLVREVGLLGGAIDDLVPPAVARAFRQRRAHSA